tara:strand:+ start:1083 stop:1622 length:540 start_codon:yes stop_codon:yes gene_type:complete
MNCRQCKDKLPQVRVDLGYKDCVSCSTVEAVSCVDITYHKTGNTIQVMDKETANKINKLAQRSGYGIMRGLRGGSTPKSKTKIVGNSGRSMRMPTQEDFNRAGEQVMSILENKDKQSALNYIDNALESRLISGSHSRQLRDILDTFSPDPVVEYVTEEPVISEEIQFAFRNWKNSKIYR